MRGRRPQVVPARGMGRASQGLRWSESEEGLIPGEDDLVEPGGAAHPGRFVIVLIRLARRRGRGRWRGVVVGRPHGACPSSWN